MPSKTVRKLPRQERAKATVDAILEATVHILLEEGLENLSTNKVAKRAGVSVGSLYQYFPNKDALVIALFERHTERMHALLQEHVAAMLEAPIAQSIHTFVRAMMDVYLDRPGLVQMLVMHGLRHQPLGRTLAIFERSEAAVSVYLAAHKDELVVDDLELAAFTVVRAVQGVWHSALWSNRDSPEVLERLAEEIGNMICRYLLGPGHTAHG